MKNSWLIWRIIHKFAPILSSWTHIRVYDWWMTPNMKSMLIKMLFCFIYLLRSTVCCSEAFLLTLRVSLIRVIIECGGCVWYEGRLECESRLKDLQRDWRREFDGLSWLDYVSRHDLSGLYSIKGNIFWVELIQKRKQWYRCWTFRCLGIRKKLHKLRSRQWAFSSFVLERFEDLGIRSYEFS